MKRRTREGLGCGAVLLALACWLALAGCANPADELKQLRKAQLALLKRLYQKYQPSRLSQLMRSRVQGGLGDCESKSDPRLCGTLRDWSSAGVEFADRRVFEQLLHARNNGVDMPETPEVAAFFDDPEVSRLVARYGRNAERIKRLEAIVEPKKAPPDEEIRWAVMLLDLLLRKT